MRSTALPPYINTLDLEYKVPEPGVRRDNPFSGGCFPIPYFEFEGQLADEVFELHGVLDERVLPPYGLFKLMVPDVRSDVMQDKTGRSERWGFCLQPMFHQFWVMEESVQLVYGVGFHHHLPCLSFSHTPDSKAS